LSSIFKKYLSVFSESKYVLVLNITDKLFSFAIFLLLARAFSTDTYGQVITIITLSTVFITIFDFGLPIFLQREISLNNSIGSNVFSKVFTISLLFFIWYLILNSLYFLIFYSGISLVLFIIIMLMMYTASLVTLVNKALSGLGSFKSQFISFLIPRLLVALFFIFGLFYYPLGLNILLFGLFTGILINLVLVFKNLKKAGIHFSFRHFSIIEAKSIIKLSLPLGLAVIFNFLYDKIDILLISKILDFTEVAFYNIGYGLFKASAISFSFLLVPGFTKVSAAGKDKLTIKNFFGEYFKIISVICIILSIVIYFTAEFIITSLYTARFSDSVLILKILAIGITAVGLNNLTGIVLNGMGYYKIVMYITLYALILNVLLNFLLLYKYGILAAAVLTVVTEMFIFFTEYYYLRKILK
jgi:O-antigen/teichoic acid export membrane protein